MRRGVSIPLIWHGGDSGGSPRDKSAVQKRLQYRSHPEEPEEAFCMASHRIYTAIPIRRKVTEFSRAYLDVLFTIVNSKSFFFSVFYVPSLSYFEVLRRTTTCDFWRREKDTVVSLSFSRRRNLGSPVRLSTWKKDRLGTQKWVEKGQSESFEYKITSKYTLENSASFLHTLCRTI